ncbi:MAG: T9SS type A sorting domain-containing protein [Bacteroidota bacterium]
MKRSNKNASVAFAAILMFLFSTVEVQSHRNGKIVDPAPSASALLITCATELTELQVDTLHGNYVQPTFRLSVEVMNASGSPVFDVEATAISADGKLVIQGSSPTILAARLDDGAGPVRAEWNATALPRAETANVQVLFMVTCRDAQGNPLATTECSVWITIPKIKQPVLNCSLSTNVTKPPEDVTIEFDEEQGGYEGEKSKFGNYLVFTITANVVNIGDAAAREVRATLLLPENMTLEVDEQSIKMVEPSDLEVQGSGQASWKVRPILGSCRPRDVTFEVLISASNRETSVCTFRMIMAELPCLVSMALPKDAIGVTGQTVIVPLYFRSNTAHPIERYRVMIGFDPALVRFVGAEPESSRTESGWRGPHTETITRPGEAEPDVVVIDDEVVPPAWANTIKLNEKGVLVNLHFKIVYDPEISINGRPGYVNQEELLFIPELNISGGRDIYASVNALEENNFSEVSLIFVDGIITVASPCAWPLVSHMRLEGNSPNPFNPSTTIVYELDQEMLISLVVLDVFGREVCVLESGYRSAGRHARIFDAENLPGGVYFYRLNSPAGASTKRMLLLR